MDYIFYLLLPFVQIGTSLYASVGTFLGMLVVFQFRRQLTAGLISHWHLALLTGFMLPSLLTGESTDLSQDVLRVAREALIAILMIGLINGAFVLPVRLRIKRVMLLSIGFFALLLILTSVQFVAYARGRYIGIPEQYYALNSGTIANDLALKYSYLRPSATFSEPSYLSFVVLSVMFMMSPAVFKRRRLATIVILGLAIGALSQALSFAVSASLTGLVYAYDRVGHRARLAFAPIVFLALISLATFGSDIGPIARILQGGTINGDYSVFARIFGPGEVLPGYLIAHPVGQPANSLLTTLLPYTNPLGLPPTEFLQNAIFDFFFEYGIFGIFPLIAIFYVRDNTVRAYLLGCMLFNGSFLSPDKLPVVGYSVIVYASMKRRGEALAPMGRDIRRNRPTPKVYGRHTSRAIFGTSK